MSAFSDLERFLTCVLLVAGTGTFYIILALLFTLVLYSCEPDDSDTVTHQIMTFLSTYVSFIAKLPYLCPILLLITLDAQMASWLGIYLGTFGIRMPPANATQAKFA